MLVLSFVMCPAPSRRFAGTPAWTRPATLEFLDSQVAELDTGAVTQEADVPLGVLEAGVLLQLRLVLDVVEVGVDDHLAVHRDGDLAALGGDLLRVPLADGLLRAALGGEPVVDLAV